MMKKFLSRKFLVFVIATALLYFGKIDSVIWLAVALIYLGMEGLLDKIKITKGE